MILKYSILSAFIGAVGLFSFCGIKTNKEQSRQSYNSEYINDSNELRIISKPILFDSVRRQLSLEYMQTHYGLKQDEPTIQPGMIVIHHTAIDSFNKSFEVLYNSTLPAARRELKAAGMLNVSAHYLIDQDGKIYQLLPDTVFARHTIGLNSIAIGIENVGGNKLPLTSAQLNANEMLVRYLKKKYPAIEWMIGHKEYTKFRNSKLWMEKDANYLTVKDDPAGNFIEQLRARLTDLQLKSEPAE